MGTREQWLAIGEGEGRLSGQGSHGSSDHLSAAPLTGAHHWYCSGGRALPDRPAVGF